jgi:hypothetical protein
VRRLAWEFYKYFDGLPQLTYWHRGRCLAYGEGVTYWALADAVSGLPEEEVDALLAALFVNAGEAASRSATRRRSRRRCDAVIAPVARIAAGTD